MREHRKFPRVPVRIPVAFSGEDTQGTGTIINLSLEGCAVQSKAPVSKGAYLKADMEIPEPNAPITVELAPVRWSDSGRFGLEFIRMDNEEQERLRRYVSSLGSGAAE